MMGGVVRFCWQKGCEDVGGWGFVKDVKGRTPILTKWKHLKKTSFCLEVEGFTGWEEEGSGRPL